jgi:spore germination cell wall hydrolase CwlJ-like protein
MNRGKTKMKKVMFFCSVVATSTAAYGSTEEFRESEIACLTQNIYHEARGEDSLGQIAVAFVTKNRRDHDYFPDTICEVVWEDHQFSWTNDGRSDLMRDEYAAQTAEVIAEWVYDGREVDPTNGALFYHTHRVNPSWARLLEEETRIGVHIFYVWDGEW